MLLLQFRFELYTIVEIDGQCHKTNIKIRLKNNAVNSQYRQYKNSKIICNNDIYINTFKIMFKIRFMYIRDTKLQAF